MEKCKFCQEELTEGSTVCPHCGKDNAPETETVMPAEEVTEETATVEEAAAEQTGTETPVEEEAADTAEQPASTEEVPVETPAETPETPKTAPWKIVAAVAAVVVLIAALAALVIGGVKGGKTPAETTEPTVAAETAATETQVPATVPADGNPDDVTCKGTYTVTDEEALAARDDVVATSGDYALTDGQLQVHYWLTVQNFYAQYGSYAPYLGLDHTQGMDTQACGVADGYTWQQYFLDESLSSWKVYAAVAQAAQKDGFQLPEDVVADLDQLEVGLEETASNNGFDDADHMLRVNFGNAVTMQDYKDYWQLYYLSSRYYNEITASFEPTDAEIAEFFNAHEAEYQEKGLTKDTSTVDVRHILITPEGEAAEDGTFSDESWTAAEKKAQELLDTFLKGDQTEDSFAVLANENSTDPGSNTNGGLYEDVSQGQMVDTFDAWCFDANRKPGDTGIVKTSYGYHVMYFVSSQTIWQDQVKSDILSQKTADFVDEALAAADAKVDYSAIKLALVDMS